MTRALLVLVSICMLSGSAFAASYSAFVRANVAFDRVEGDAGLDPSVITAIRTLIPDGSSVVAELVLEDTTADQDPDVDIGFFEGAVVRSRIEVNGFTTPLDDFFCNPNLDCFLRTINDFIPTSIGNFDQLQLASHVLGSQDLSEAVTNATGISPVTGNGFAVNDPLRLNLRIFETEIDLIDDDGFVDPRDFFEEALGSLVVFASPNWKTTKESPSARVIYSLCNISVGEVPTPGAAILLLTGLGGLMIARRRKAV